MGKPAARIGDMHVCPMVTPGLPPIPHVGGPITGPGCPTVLIGGAPAAVMGDMCVCVGPPDSIVLGSSGVMIGGKPAARMGDQCAHGGTIMVGCPTVLIGEVSPGPPVIVIPDMMEAAKPGMVEAAEGLAKTNALKTEAVTSVFTQTAAAMTAPFATKLSRIQGLLQAAEDGEETVHKHNDNQCKVQYQLHSDGNGKAPAKDISYQIKTSDGNTFSGKTDSNGMTRQITGYMEGDCTLSFPD